MNKSLDISRNRIKAIRRLKHLNLKISLIWSLLSTIIIVLTYKCEAQIQPKLILPIGHTSEVNSANFSPDGKKIVSASDDKTAKIWDVETGKLLSDLKGHTDYVYYSCFSPDGSTIVSASADSTVKIWDASKGMLLADLKGHQGIVRTVSYSPDGKRIATASEDGSVKIWNAITGELINTIKVDRLSVNSAQFSPNGNVIVTASDGDGAKLWDANTGNLITDLDGHYSSGNCANFSSDGTKVITGGMKYDSTHIWNAITGELIVTLKDLYADVNSAIFSPDGKTAVTLSSAGTIIIWDVETGQEIHELKGHTDQVTSVCFSPDGKMIVTASWDKTAKIWDAVTGKLLRDLTGHKWDVLYANFSPDGKKIVTASSDKTVKIWDALTGEQLADMKGHTESVITAEFSPNGKTGVIASEDNFVRTWDIMTGKLLNVMNGHTDMINSASYTHDGNIIVTISIDSTIKIWNANSGTLSANITGQICDSRRVSLSPDGLKIATVSIGDLETSLDTLTGKLLFKQDYTVTIWDILTGKSIITLPGQNDVITSISFSPDGRKIVTGLGDGAVKIWDVVTGNLIMNLTYYTDPIFTVSFSPDGLKVIAGTFYKRAMIWFANVGVPVHILEGHNDYVVTALFSPDGSKVLTGSDHYGDSEIKIWDAGWGNLLAEIRKYSLLGTNFASFSPDGKRFTTTSFNDTAKIWDTSTGHLHKNLIGHSSTVYCANYSPDGNFIITASSDNTSRIWNAFRGELLYTLIAINEKDFLAVDKYYRYDGTEAARDLLYFTCGTEIIDLKQMKDALYVPGLVEKIMSGQEINYPKLEDLEICDALPLIEQAEKDDGNYHFSIVQRRLPLESVEVYVNDKRVMTIPAEELSKKNEIYYLDLKKDDLVKHFIPGADNSVEVIAIVMENGNILQSRGVSVIQEVPSVPGYTPSLYALMIGVNEYKDPGLHLNFPSKDAMDLGKAIELSASKLLGRDHVFLYQVNTEVMPGQGFTTPEKEGIRRAMEDIAKKAKPEDVILIFFAGHGVMQGADEKRFTLLTADASRVNPVGISTKDLESWLSYDGPFKMLANKTILILDACHTGQAISELLALARTDDETRRIRQVEDLKDKAGLFILAASASDQSAYELPQYSQGLLTYSLLHTIKNDPDILDENRYLNVQKWFLESEKYLQQLMSSLGYDQDAQPFGTANIRIGEVDEEVKNSIHLSAEKPVVICANVMNSATFSDNLGLKNLINQELEDISERGTESKILYSRQESPGANLINIMYRVVGNEVLCEVRLVKGGEQLHQSEVSGNTKRLEELAKKIIEDIVIYTK